MQRRIAFLGGVIALALVPLVPAGLEIILAGAAVPLASWSLRAQGDRV